MIDLKDQYFGVEIEMTGITRNKAAKVVGEMFGSSPQYTRDHNSWYIKDREGKKWKFSYDGSIQCYKVEHGRKVRAVSDYSTEMVSPKLSYDEMGKL